MSAVIKARDLQVLPCSLKDIRQFVEANHYSHSVNGVKISYCFEIRANKDLVGAIIFGSLSTTAWRKFADKENKVLELRRLVLLNQAERNSESRVVGFALRWLKKNSPETEIVISYADPKYGHLGIIYKATNFKYVGLSGADKGYEDIITGKVYHSRAMRTKYKGEYKPFVKKLREKLKNGLLKVIDLPGKHCYIYNLK